MNTQSQLTSVDETAGLCNDLGFANRRDVVHFLEKRSKKLPLASSRKDHEGYSQHQQERGQPGHAEISHAMQIKYSRYDCCNKEQESNQADERRIHE